MRKLTNELKEQISDFMFESQNRFGISLQYKYEEGTHYLIMNDEDMYFDDEFSEMKVYEGGFLIWNENLNLY